MDRWFWWPLVSRRLNIAVIILTALIVIWAVVLVTVAYGAAGSCPQTDNKKQDICQLYVREHAMAKDVRDGSTVHWRDSDVDKMRHWGINMPDLDSWNHPGPTQGWSTGDHKLLWSNSRSKPPVPGPCTICKGNQAAVSGDDYYTCWTYWASHSETSLIFQDPLWTARWEADVCADPAGVIRGTPFVNFFTNPQQFNISFSGEEHAHTNCPCNTFRDESDVTVRNEIPLDIHAGVVGWNGVIGAWRPKIIFQVDGSHLAQYLTVAIWEFPPIVYTG